MSSSDALAVSSKFKSCYVGLRAFLMETLFARESSLFNLLYYLTRYLVLFMHQVHVDLCGKSVNKNKFIGDGL